MPALPARQTLGLSLLHRILDDNDGLPRPVEYFGVTAVPEDGTTPVDGLANLQTAADWSANHGGSAVTLSGGVYGIDGTLITQPQTTIIGAGERQTILQQLSIATTLGGTYANVIETPGPADDGGAFVTLERFTIDGGWNLRTHQGATTPNWEYELAGMTQRGIWFRGTTNPYGPEGGPAHVLMREDSADAHHQFHHLKVRNIAGIGILMEGRGEMNGGFLEIHRCAENGLLNDSPDNWLGEITAYTTGASALVIAQSNNEIHKFKGWFNGMCRLTENVAANFETRGAGTSGIKASGRLQDAWGPCLHVVGIGHQLNFDMDEGGGGRVEKFNVGGFQGTRTENRAVIRVDDAKNCTISGVIRGGDQIVPQAVMVDFDNSGANHNTIDLVVPTDDVSRTVTARAGLANSKRHNLVKVNGQVVYGKRTEAELKDAAHGINLVGYQPELVHLTDGRIATKTASGWNVPALGDQWTPV